MSTLKRLSRAVREAYRIPINNTSKIVMLSDCHRGNGSGADDFAKNQNLCYTALRHYDREGFTYIELGDGDELWKNRRFEDISREYEQIFILLSKMYSEGRMHVIFGNHDIAKSNDKWVQNNLYSRYDERERKDCPLFPGLKVRECILLCDEESGREMILLHGHQADFFNDRLWRLSRFLVRYVWQPLELIGVKDPTRASIDGGRRDQVEQNLMSFSDKEKKILVCGHTHHPVFPNPGETLYFNDGSCVHPRYITALEIENGAISMARWNIATSQHGFLFVNREIAHGPVALKKY